MPIIEVELDVHVKNPRYGMPLCWNPKDEITTFEADFDESKVTCRKCLKLLQE